MENWHSSQDNICLHERCALCVCNVYLSLQWMSIHPSVIFLADLNALVIMWWWWWWRWFYLHAQLNSILLNSAAKFSSIKNVLHFTILNSQLFFFVFSLSIMSLNCYRVKDWWIRIGWHAERGRLKNAKRYHGLLKLNRSFWRHCKHARATKFERNRRNSPNSKQRNKHKLTDKKNAEPKTATQKVEKDQQNCVTWLTSFICKQKTPLQSD